PQQNPDAPMKMAPPTDNPHADAHHQPNEGAQRENKDHKSRDSNRQMPPPLDLESVSIPRVPQYPRRQHSHTRNEERGGKQADATAQQVNAALQAITIKLLIAKNLPQQSASDPYERAQ